MSAEKLTTAVEAYLTDLRNIRASGGATGERSYYPPLNNLLNAVGSALKPKVFCVSEMAQQGAGHPDVGLYAAKQLQKDDKATVAVAPISPTEEITACRTPIHQNEMILRR